MILRVLNKTGETKMSSDGEGNHPKRMSGEERPSGPALPSGANEFHHHVIPTERCGALNVWVQGDLALARNEGKDQYPVFLVKHLLMTFFNFWYSNPKHFN